MGTTTRRIVVSRTDTGEIVTETCLTCGFKGPMPLIETRYVENGRRGSERSCGPHCRRCAAKYERGALPVHPSWFRTSDPAMAA